MKKILSFALSCVVAITAAAQGFSSFTVEGSLVPASIRNIVDGVSIVDVLVSETTPINNVKFKYRLYSNSSLSKELTPDFQLPQQVTILKTDGTSKDWMVRVKQLKAAKVPFSLDFSDVNPSEWSNDAVGWAGIGIDETKPSVIRFGNKGVSFWVAVDGKATKVNYKLMPVSRTRVEFDGEFVVEASVNGRTWEELKIFDQFNQISIDGNYQHELPKNVKYIRWTYVSRNKLNINLNAISVTAE